MKVNRLLLNNIDVRGVGWGAFAMARPGYMRGQWDALLPMIESGVVDPPVGDDVPGRGGGAGPHRPGAARVLGKTVLTLCRLGVLGVRPV